MGNLLDLKVIFLLYDVNPMNLKVIFNGIYDANPLNSKMIFNGMKS